MPIYADFLDLQDIIMNYNKYLNTGAIQANQTQNYKDVSNAYNNVVLKDASEEYLNKTLTDLLKQPAMANAYAANGVQPEDVPAFIESVMKKPASMKENILLSMVGSYGTAAGSKKMERIPTIDGSQEWIALSVQLNINKSLIASMKQFTEEQKPVAKKLSMWEKIQRKFGFDKELDSGTNEAVEPTKGATRIMQMTAKEASEQVKKAEAKGVKHFEMNKPKSEEYGDR